MIDKTNSEPGEAEIPSFIFHVCIIIHSEEKENKGEGD